MAVPCRQYEDSSGSLHSGSQHSASHAPVENAGGEYAPESCGRSDDQRSDKCLILINRLVSSDYVGNTAKNPIIDTELSVTAEMFNGRIVIVDRDFKIIADTFNLAEGKLNISQEVLKAYSGEEQSSYNRKKDYFSLAFPIPGKDENESAEGVLLLTASTENIDLLEARVTEKITFFQLVVFWVVAVFGLLAAGLLLKPFIRLKKVLGAVAEGDLEQDIRVDTYRETKEISEAVSQTLRKLKAVDQSRQEFVPMCPMS